MKCTWSSPQQDSEYWFSQKTTETRSQRLGALIRKMFIVVNLLKGELGELIDFLLSLHETM